MNPCSFQITLFCLTSLFSAATDCLAGGASLHSLDLESSAHCTPNVGEIHAAHDELTDLNDIQHDASVLSLLQTSRSLAVHRKSHSDECQKLKFLHIPKNMGSSVKAFIERNNLSFIASVPDGVGNAPGKMARTLGLVRPFEYGIPGAENNDGILTYFAHTPPAFLSNHDNAYVGKDVFCVVRDPYERAVSIYKYRQMDTLVQRTSRVKGQEPEFAQLDCSKEGLNLHWQSWIREYQTGRRSAKNVYDTFLYPQSLLVYGPDGPHRNTSVTECMHVLRIEQMPGALNTVLSDYNCDVQMSEEEEENVNSDCSELGVTDFTQETLAMLTEHYRSDFELLGFVARS